MYKILIMGLPGSGKTTLSQALRKEINAIHLNADEIRRTFKDWDFSLEGRIRQSDRMRSISEALNAEGYNTIADFVCPTMETRKAFGDAFIIWVDTIEQSKYQNTNSIFETPDKVDVRITKSLTTKEAIDLIKEKLYVTFC